jgi:tRNA U34 5-methylaminomethyl-2-thiouridine-forming methyltransferase MnmC
MSRIRLELCADGSHTLYLPDLDETYHSRHGAIPESQYVFIQKGWQQLTQANPIHVLEIGMGTGLNALLTRLEAEKDQRQTIYHTLEPYPIDNQLVEALNYCAILGVEKAKLSQIHENPWGETTALSPFFELRKEQTTLENSLLPQAYFDVIYFDAFAPNKQSEVWQQANLARCYDALREGGCLVTYCAQGEFKRNLKAVGFEIEKLAGPPYKREMVRAWKKT